MANGETTIPSYLPRAGLTRARVESSRLGPQYDSTVQLSSKTKVQRHTDATQRDESQESNAKYMTVVWVGLAIGAIYYFSK